MKRQNLLVPLDGSRSAEAALPYAVTLAQACGLGVELLAVARPTGDCRDGVGLTTLMLECLQTRLRVVANELRAGGISVETAVRQGDPAEVILLHAEKVRSRAVVMTTHGMGDRCSPLPGAVAEMIVREAPCPVLLIRPNEDDHRPMSAWHPRRLLVPLDGSRAAEAALPAAYELAAAMNTEVVLARVQPWTAAQLGALRSYISNVALMDEEAAHAAADYLRAHRLGAPAGVAVHGVVLRGDPAARLTEFAQVGDVDLVVMTSHSRSGVCRQMLGSVTEQLTRQGTPLLIVRPMVAEV